MRHLRDDPRPAQGMIPDENGRVWCVDADGMQWGWCGMCTEEVPRGGNCPHGCESLIVPFEGSAEKLRDVDLTDSVDWMTSAQLYRLLDLLPEMIQRRAPTLEPASSQGDPALRCQYCDRIITTGTEALTVADLAQRWSPLGLDIAAGTAAADYDGHGDYHHLTYLCPSCETPCQLPPTITE